MRYLFEDRRNGNWKYKHQLPDGTWFTRSMKTSDRKLAEQGWSTIDAEYNALAAEQRVTKKYEDSKDARRDKFWQAVARFMIAMKAANGGSLPRPAIMGVPTVTHYQSHPFAYVRGAFLRWAKDNDPDAVKVFHMGDMNEDKLFHTGLVAAYFTISELERLQGPAQVEVATPVVPASIPPIPENQHTLEVVFQRWAKETDPAESTLGDVKRAMAIFANANPQTDPESPQTVEQISRKHIQKMRDALGNSDLSNVTRNKRLAGISILLGQAIREFWIESNPTLGVKFEVKDGETSKRESFDRDELKAWMKHPTFTQHRFDTYGWSEFWIPLLCVWHGARRNEIGHLLTSDVEKKEGIWCLNIDGMIGGGTGKKL